MTSPQGPWQQNPQGGQPPYGTPSGGFPQQNQPGYPPQEGYPQQAGYQQQPGYPQQPGYQQYPQAGYQQSPYSAPPVGAYEGAGLARPTTINIAFWISIIVPVVATVLMAVSFLIMQGWMNDLINSSVEAEGVDPNSPEARQAASIGSGVMMVVFVVMLIFYAVLTGLWILFGFKLRAGRNWARVTLTIFAAIWLLSGVGGLIGGATGMASMGQLPPGTELPGNYLAMSYAQSGLAVAGMIAFVVLVYLKPSNWFFQAAAHR